jgi:hypothetical protein
LDAIAGAAKVIRSNMQYFLRGMGMGSVLDIFGIMYDIHAMQILACTDAEALASDWQAIGDDIRNAIGVYNATSKNR